MITPIAKITSFVYINFAKPLLFKFSPDDVHHGMTKTSQIVQAVLPLRWLIKLCWRYDNKFLRTEMLGISFSNPIGLSAGFDKDAKLAPLLHAVGFGLAECGSVTLESYGGNPKPWYGRLPKSQSIVVNSGLKSDGVKAFIDNMIIYPKALTRKMPINVSIARTNSPKTSTLAAGIKDYCGSLRLLDQHNFQSLYTINISCPNTYGGEPFTQPDNLNELLTAIDKLNLSRPVFLKLPIDNSWPEIDALLAIAAKHKIAGITIGNLRKNRQKAGLKEPLPDSVKGNLGGKPCQQPSDELLAQAYRKYGDRFKFIGVGGVFSAQDAYTKIKLGASLVELITGMIYNGPSLIGQINQDLVKLAQKDGYQNISQAIGADINKENK